MRAEDAPRIPGSPYLTSKSLFVIAKANYEKECFLLFLPLKSKHPTHFYS